MRALNYCRVSTEKQAEGDRTSLEDQEKANAAKLRALGCSDNEIEVVREMDTGTKWEERKELRHALKQIEAGRYQFICIYNVDRAVRTWEFIAFLSSACKKGNARLVFAQRDYDQSSFGDLMMVVDAFRAQWGREDVLKNMRRGRRGRMESGKVHRFGPELYGYRRDRERSVRVVHEPEAAIVRRIFEWKADGLGYYQIAKQLNTEAVPTPGRSKNFTRKNASGSWMPTTIVEMIKNSAYKGAAVAWTRKADGKGRTVATDESEHIQVSAKVTPAIVAPALWQRANDAGRNNRGDKKRNMDRPILLRGLVRCDGCGYRLYYEGSGGNYRCRKAGVFAGKPAHCQGRPVKAAALEDWAWRQVRGILERPEILQAAITDAEATGETAADLQARLDLVRRQLSEIERQQRKLLDEMLGDESESWRVIFENKKYELSRQRHQAAEQVATLARQIEQIDQIGAHAAEVVELCLALKENLEQFGFEEKRTALEALGVEVIASGQDWRLSLSIPASGEVSETSQYVVYVARTVD